MGVITVSSELGSGGVEIADGVAKILGIEVADELVCDRILRQYGLTKFKELYDSAPSLLDLVRFENLTIISMYNEILEGLARRGDVVIMSRVGFAVLGGCADALNVHVVAPVAQRVQGFMASQGLTDAAAAEERLRDDDDAHRKFVQRFYNRNSDEPAGYGLTVDTGSTSVDEGAGQIAEAARAATREPAPPGVVTTRSLEIDPVLAGAVDEVLAERAKG